MFFPLHSRAPDLFSPFRLVHDDEGNISSSDFLKQAVVDDIALALKGCMCAMEDVHGARRSGRVGPPRVVGKGALG
jgi:hypothetical protein